MTCSIIHGDTFVGCGLHESILVLYKIIMYESMPVLYYYESMPVILFTCMCVQMRMYNYTLYVYMQTCCWLQEVQVLGRCHALSHTFCNLFTLQLTCEKDVGMGLCTFNFVLRLSLHHRYYRHVNGIGIIAFARHITVSPDDELPV